MQWLNSFSLIMRSNITTLREKFEDPERMIHQLIIDMEHELELVRNSVAEAIADEIQLGKKVQKAKSDVDGWTERATASLKRGDEAAAEAALEQKVAAQQRAESLETEYAKQKTETEKLRKSVGDLEGKIRQARQKQTLLLARMTRANSTVRINQALDRATSKSAFAQFSRLEQRADRAEAMSEAYDRLDGRDPEAEELEEQFAAAERKEQIAKELEELKSRVQAED
jgi:phage shock protein A